MPGYRLSTYNADNEYEQVTMFRLDESPLPTEEPPGLHDAHRFIALVRFRLLDRTIKDQQGFW